MRPISGTASPLQGLNTMSRAMLYDDSSPLTEVVRRVRMRLDQLKGLRARWAPRGQEPAVLNCGVGPLAIDKKGCIGISFDVVGTTRDGAVTSWEIVLDYLTDHMPGHAAVRFADRTAAVEEGVRLHRTESKVPVVPNPNDPIYYYRRSDTAAGRWRYIDGPPTPEDLATENVEHVVYHQMKDPTAVWWGSFILRFPVPVGPLPFQFGADDLDPRRIDEEVTDRWMLPGMRAVYKRTKYVYIGSYRLRPNKNRNTGRNGEPISGCSNGVYRHMMAEDGTIVYGKTFFGAAPDIDPDSVIV